jgi:hypothetical protein
MAAPQTPAERARHIVNLHTNGIICPRLVWDGFVTQATAETFPQFMAHLTPDLQDYFQYVVLPSEPCDEPERQAMAWLAAYYAHNA